MQCRLLYSSIAVSSTDSTKPCSSVVCVCVCLWYVHVCGVCPLLYVSVCGVCMWCVCMCLVCVYVCVWSVYMCVCVRVYVQMCVSMCRCSWSPAEGVSSVTGLCLEMPSLGAGKLPQVPCKSRTFSPAKPSLQPRVLI